METGNGGTLTYRVQVLERELEKLESRTDISYAELRTQLTTISREQAVLKAQLDAFQKNVYIRLDQLEGSVNDDVKGLRKVLIIAALTVMTGAVGFAITSLAVFGGPG